MTEPAPPRPADGLDRLDLATVLAGHGRSDSDAMARVGASTVLRAGETPVCERCDVADTPLTRLKGLLGRSGLRSGEGLLIRPTSAIHTCFMRFPIDAVFLDRDLVVLRAVSDVPAWRFAGCRRARAVLELAAGEIRRRGIRPGDRLQFGDPVAQT
jgi:uncharacterized membrane protein (UPF0127 family)